MSNVTDFYDELDLRYPEIGIAIQEIDRIKPGKVKFIIPILTPNMDITKEVEQKVYQNSTNLMNLDTTIEIENLDVYNYIEIPIPRELCSICDGLFDIIEGEKPEEKSKINTLKEANMKLSSASQSGSGSVSCEAGSISVTGRVSGIMEYTDAKITGRVNILPVDRYIPIYSKWIIMFLGGDITKPIVIARYPEPEEESEEGSN